MNADEGHSIDGDFGKDLASMNDAASKGPLSALLSPAFTVWGKKLEEFAEWTAGKRRENLEAHKEAVLQANPDMKMEEPSLKQVKLLAMWSEHAQDVEEGEPEAALWRAILDDILKKSVSSAHLIDIAGRMNPRDIHELMPIPIDGIFGRPANQMNLQNLISLGLVISDTSNESKGEKIRKIFGTSATAFCLLYTIACYVVYRYEYISEIAGLFTMVAIMVFMCLIFFLFGPNNQIWTTLKPSPEGERLSSKLKMFGWKED